MHPDEPSERRGPTPASEGMLGQVLRVLLGGPPPRGGGLQPSSTVHTVELERLRDEPGPSEPAVPTSSEPTGRGSGDRAGATAVMAPEDEIVVEDAGQGGSSIDPRVLADLQHPTSRARLEALEGLRRHPRTAPVVAVTARLQDPEPQVREAAVAVLEATGDERMLVLLLDALGDPSEQVRLAVRRAILDRAGPSLIDLLRRELHAPARCAAAAILLAEMGQGDAVVEAMHRVDPAARRLIADALRDAGTTARLIEELTDGRPDRRRLAAERLGVIGARNALEALIQRLEDPDRDVRIAAAEALGRIGDAEAVHPLKRSLVWDPDAGVAVAVGQALRKIAGRGGGPRTVRV